ncbi:MULTISPECIES: NADP-dependent oxidoreductase [Pseudoalteromonas]|uniref:NADP-dependent oxidoreductase n=1 Tax=Pseudoalteromonas TaxID=53246 RepID=UPI000FFF1758|nr:MULTISPECIES: NADP-dependent oxidoreductase [Pseudoalteromonas]NKC21158.1 zinc-binding dehydrogenase [Pseudoalteromonas galatheae]RXE89520.1 NADP-dependent oxidoreductase [Pseudoalteromonas sp. A757]
MKAIVIEQYGQADQLNIIEISAPKPENGQLRVQVKAASVNPVDTMIRAGMLENFFSLPLVAGWDVAGVVLETVGDNQGFQVGDEIMAMIPIGQPGAYAEQVIVDSALVVKKPENISFEQAAGVPMVSLTAWQAIHDLGKVSSGQTVLVHGGSSAVGAFAIQYAKLAGAYVIATASAPNHAYLYELGVDQCIDYRNEQFEVIVRNIDLVFAAIGEEGLLERSLKVIKPKGKLVSTLNEIKHEVALSYGVEFHRVWVAPDRSKLAHIANLLSEGQIWVKIDSVFPFEEVVQAHQRSESKRAVGKIILTI